MAEAEASPEAYVVTLSEGGQIVIPKFMRTSTHPGERFLIVKAGDGFYLKPVRSLELAQRVREVQSQVHQAVLRAGLSQRDLERISAKVRRTHKGSKEAQG